MLKVDKVINMVKEMFGEVAEKLSRDEARYVYRIMNSASKEKSKRRSVKMLRYNVSTGIATEIPTSETRWMRKLCPDATYLNDFVVVDLDKNPKTADMNNGAVFTFGVSINPNNIVCDEANREYWISTIKGKTFRFFLQSPSQSRTASAVFMTQYSQDYASQWLSSIKTVMGYMPEDMAIVKFLSATGLSQTSTKEFRPVTFKIVNDYVGKLPNGQDHPYTDGFGKIKPSVMKELADKAGLNYIPSGVQVRIRPAVKGFLVADEFEGKEDVLLTESMVKVLRENQDSGMLEYALFSKPAHELTPACYQYIQATKLTGAELIMFANRHFERLNGILHDASKAMKYLGMIGHSEEEDMESVYEEELNSKVMRALDANPATIHDPWVQLRLKNMMERTIMDMRHGRIPLHAGYHFIITEPKVLDGNEPLLKAGQAYLNGQTGKVACFRSPLIHRSEAMVLELVTSPELEKAYGHIKDILILNVKDDSLPRAGGADCDGDKFYVCYEKEVVNAVETGLEAIVSEGKGKAEKITINYNAVVAHVARNSKRSMVGFVTDLGTTWADMYRTECDPEKAKVYDGMVKHTRVLQGEIIDAPKTGKNVIIDEKVQTPFRPHWLERTGLNIKVYHSVSPMGMLYDYILASIKIFMENNKGIDHSLVMGLLEQVNPNGYYAVFPKVQEYLDGYKKEIGAVIRMFEGQYSEEAEEQRSKLTGAIAEKYGELMDSLCAITDPVTVAGVAMYLSYQKASKDSGFSFPWVTCFEGLIEGLSRVSGERFMLVPFKGFNGSAPSSIEVKNNLAFEGDNFVGVSKVEDGIYDIFCYNDRTYVKVPRTTALSAVVPARSKFQVAVVGLNAPLCKALISLVGYKVEIKRFQVKDGLIQAGVFYEGKRIGKVSDDSLLEAVCMLDRPIEVLQISPSKTGKSANMYFEIVA
ncbi:MAG TPA: hypothetical protein VK190_03405 [Pseudoneobacillus sp.]|jgi:hypothetical protein|nr:hypothetical protein [Pseudoneobacillus sp.]